MKRLAHGYRKTDAEACGGTEHRFENRFRFRKNCLVLDAGCECGRFNIPLASRSEQVAAIDLSLSMLRTGSRCSGGGIALNHFRVERLDVVRYDTFWLPSGEHPADGISLPVPFGTHASLD